MNRCSEQDLICIDVTDAGNCLLMHQERLESPAVPMHELDKLVLTDDQRIPAKAAGHVALESFTIDQGQPAEPPRIPIPKRVVRAFFKRDDGVDVLRMFDDGPRQQEESGHAQFGNEIASLAAFFHLDDDTFALATDRSDAGSAVPIDRLAALADDVAPPHLNVGDAQSG